MYGLGILKDMLWVKSNFFVNITIYFPITIMKKIVQLMLHFH